LYFRGRWAKVPRFLKLIVGKPNGANLFPGWQHVPRSKKKIRQCRSPARFPDERDQEGPHIIATVFMPPTFLAGIYGMNFRRMPELEWRWGYIALRDVMVANRSSC
jgi:hypothetical protein